MGNIQNEVLLDLIINNMRIPVEIDGRDAYVKAAAEKLNLDERQIAFVRILSKSLDARGKSQFYYEMSIVVSIPDTFENTENYPVYAETIRAARKSAHMKERPVIIGFGPAGMFAALEFIDYGIK